MSPRRRARPLKPTQPSVNEAPLCNLHGARPTMDQNPIPCAGKLNIDEATLRKLRRAELQKLAKENKVKANMKSELIIQELVKICEVVRLDLDEESEEPQRKKSRTSPHEQTGTATSCSLRSGLKENPAVVGGSTQITDRPVDTPLDDQPLSQEESQQPAPTTGNTAPIIACKDVAELAAENPEGTLQDLSPVLESQAGHPPPEDDTSDSGSNLSYASKDHRYNSPVSSRAGTPPLEDPKILERAVNIMNRITADDKRILSQIAALRERAATLKGQAKKVRDVVRAEQGRRERLEAYFTYWQEMPPTWPTGWLYEEDEEKEEIKTKKMPGMPPLIPPTVTSG